MTPDRIPMPPSLFFRTLLLGACCLAAHGCAGYRWGAHSLYRSDVRTVYVPMIESDSFRRNLGERLTEAVVKQIEATTPYKVVATPDADSTLRCRLTDDKKRVTIETATDEPRSVELAFHIVVEWLDRRGQPLNQTTQIPLPHGLSVTQQAEFIPEAGQSVATAQQEAFVRLAGQIVSQMQIWW